MVLHLQMAPGVFKCSMILSQTLLLTEQTNVDESAKNQFVGREMHTCPMNIYRQAYTHTTTLLYIRVHTSKNAHTDTHTCAHMASYVTH